MTPTFEMLFGMAPQARAAAPGRVNLMGDHTDYNDGFVLPIAIAHETTVEIACAETFPSQTYSVNTGEMLSFQRDSMPGYSKYVGGCVFALEDRGQKAPPLRLRIESTVPVGIGLSSSAALEVATLRAIAVLLSIDMNAVELALVAQDAEITYAGVRCGIMDQMACSLASRDKMMFLDTRSLAAKLLPLPVGCEVIVADSGATRHLQKSAYNQRRAECDEAAKRLGVGKLRDVSNPNLVNSLGSPFRERARHVITENQRVIAALEADALNFGSIMNDSHRSLRDDFDVSAPLVDKLVSALQEHPEVYGARMTGAGFGGACVALARPGSADRIRAAIARSAPEARMISP